jgi:putative endonuclease
VKSYYVYMLTNDSGTLYIGVTNNLSRRVDEHRSKVVPGFTSKYRLSRLVYYEETNDVWAALEREKQLKKWRREKKIALAKSLNPEWRDLASSLA